MERPAAREWSGRRLDARPAPLVAPSPRLPRSAPSGPRTSAPRSYNNYNVYTAPPLVGGYGYGLGMPFFGGGVG